MAAEPAKENNHPEVIVPIINSQSKPEEGSFGQITLTWEKLSLIVPSKEAPAHVAKPADYVVTDPKGAEPMKTDIVPPPQMENGKLPSFSQKTRTFLRYRP